MEKITAKMVDHSHNEIKPNGDRDDIFLGVEQMSGVCAVAQQRLQMNFYIAKDTLFDFFPNDYMVPLAFVQREATITPAQIK